MVQSSEYSAISTNYCTIKTPKCKRINVISQVAFAIIGIMQRFRRNSVLLNFNNSDKTKEAVSIFLTQPLVWYC